MVDINRSVGEHIDGHSIAGRIVGEKDWWRLAALAIEPLTDAAQTVDAIDCAGFIGRGWDGTSDIELGRTRITAVEVRAILVDLRTEMETLGITTAKLLDERSVRRCSDGRTARSTLVIDVDLEQFILPLSIDHPGLTPSTLPVVKSAWGMRERLAARDLRVRRAVEETAASVGHGVAPIWARLHPIRHYASPRDLADAIYSIAYVALDGELEWSLAGGRWVSSITEIRKERGEMGRRQRSRSKALASLRKCGSVGFVTEVAARLLEEHNLDALATLHRARELSRGTTEATGIKLDRGGFRETLHWRDGALVATLEYKGGVTAPDYTLVFREISAVLAIALKGRLLNEIVDHPALRGCRLRVKRTVKQPGVVELGHSGKMTPVELLPSIRPS